MGRYLKNVVTLALDVDKCVGCQRCLEVCPHAVFAFIDKRAKIQDRDACMECGACAKNCAPGAITVEAGVGCAQAIFNSWRTGKLECDCGPKCCGESQ